MAGSVGRSDERAEPHVLAVSDREGPERGLAVAFEGDHHAPLRRHALARRFVVERGEELAHLAIIFTTLDAERALPHRGERHLGLEDIRRARFEREAHETGTRENDRIAFACVDFLEARVDVAAHGNDLEIGSRRLQAHGAAEARSADLRSWRQREKRSVLRRDEHVPRVLTLRNTRNEESRRENARHVLDRVHGEARAIVEERFLDLLHEEAFSAHFGEGTILDLVAGRDDLHLVRLQMRMGRDEPRDERATLCESERRTAGRVGNAHREEGYVTISPMRRGLLGIVLLSLAACGTFGSEGDPAPPPATDAGTTPVVTPDAGPELDAGCTAPVTVTVPVGADAYISGGQENTARPEVSYCNMNAGSCLLLFPLPSEVGAALGGARVSSMELTVTRAETASECTPCDGKGFREDGILSAFPLATDWSEQEVSWLAKDGTKNHPWQAPGATGPTDTGPLAGSESVPAATAVAKVALDPSKWTSPFVVASQIAVRTTFGLGTAPRGFVMVFKKTGNSNVTPDAPAFLTMKYCPAP